MEIRELKQRESLTQEEGHQGTNVKSNGCMSEGKEKKGIYHGDVFF